MIGARDYKLVQKSELMRDKIVALLHKGTLFAGNINSSIAIICADV